MNNAATEQPMSVSRSFMPHHPRNAPPRPIDWMRRNLFSSLFNGALTIVVLVMACLILPPLFRWAITHATVSGVTRAACSGDGACWTFIRVRFPRFIYGSYPSDQYWRVDTAVRLARGLLRPGAA